MDAISHLGNFFKICVTRALTQTYFSGWGGVEGKGQVEDDTYILKQLKPDEPRFRTTLLDRVARLAKIVMKSDIGKAMHLPPILDDFGLEEKSCPMREVLKITYT